MVAAANRPMRASEPGCSRSFERRGRVGAKAEQQPAPDRDAVQQYVGNLTDSVRNEPLEPFVRSTHDQTGQDR